MPYFGECLYHDGCIPGDCFNGMVFHKRLSGGHFETLIEAAHGWVWIRVYDYSDKSWVCDGCGEPLDDNPARNVLPFTLRATFKTREAAEDHLTSIGVNRAIPL